MKKIKETKTERKKNEKQKKENEKKKNKTKKRTTQYGSEQKLVISTYWAGPPNTGLVLGRVRVAPLIDTTGVK